MKQKEAEPPPSPDMKPPPPVSAVEIGRRCLNRNKPWTITHGGYRGGSLTVDTDIQGCLSPPTDHSRPGEHWYHERVIVAYSQLLTRAQTRTMGVMSRNDVVLTPDVATRITEVQDALHSVIS